MTIEFTGWVVAAFMAGCFVGLCLGIKVWSMNDIAAGVTRIAGKYYRLTPAEVK